MSEAFDRRKGIMIVAGIGIVILLILYPRGLFTRGRVEPGETPRPTGRAVQDTETLDLALSDLPMVVQFVGTVRSRDQVDVSARILARIRDIKVRSGDAVKAGDLLAQLDDKDLAAGVQQSREGVQAAKATLSLAEKERARAQELFDQKVIPQQKLDQAITAERQAQAVLASAEQQQRQVEATLSYARIVSAMDGIVAERLADPGDLASPGRILFRLFDPTRLLLEVPVRESLAAEVKIGRKVPFAVPAIGKTFEGEIREVVPAVDPGSRTFLVKVCIGTAPDLKPGMFGTLALEVGQERAIVVPAAAIQRIGQLEYATIAVSGQPRRLLVRSGPAGAGKARVLSGLEVGMRLVLNP
jgi:membrane fusion protein, multidrug efflux system